MSLAALHMRQAHQEPSMPPASDKTTMLCLTANPVDMDPLRVRAGLRDSKDGQG